MMDRTQIPDKTDEELYPGDSNETPGTPEETKPVYNEFVVEVIKKEIHVLEMPIIIPPEGRYAKYHLGAFAIESADLITKMRLEISSNQDTKIKIMQAYDTIDETGQVKSCENSSWISDFLGGSEPNSIEKDFPFADCQRLMVKVFTGAAQSGTYKGFLTLTLFK